MSEVRLGVPVEPGQLKEEGTSILLCKVLAASMS